MDARFHWLAMTFHCEYDTWADLIYTGFLKNLFGDLSELPHGGRGYRRISQGLAGFQLYHDPVSHGKGTHVHMVLPGSACESVLPHDMINLFTWLYQQPTQFVVTRIDIAVDGCPFTPMQFEQAIEQDHITSLAKRETLHFDSSPFELREDGEMGCTTVYLGSRASDRFIRVYNKRGFTRAELQCSEERAAVIAKDLFTSNYQDWLNIIVGHIRQFIEVHELWWGDFCGSSERKDIKISIPRVVSAEKLDRWMRGQVAGAFYALDQLTDEEYRAELLEQGKKNIQKQRKKGTCRYEHLLNLVGK